MKTNGLARKTFFAALAVVAGCGGAEETQGTTADGSGASGGGDSTTSPTGGSGGGIDTGAQGGGGSGGNNTGGAGGSTSTGTPTGTDTPTGTGTGNTQSCAPSWTRVFHGDISQQFITNIVPDEKGDILVCGYFEGTMDAGGGALTSDVADMFLVKLDKDGNHLWSKLLGGPLNQVGQVVPDGQGGIILTGQMEGSMDLGAGPLVSEGGFDAFIARFDAAGDLLWNKSFGGPGYQNAGQARIDPMGNIVLSGRFEQSIDLGEGPLTSAGDHDAYVAKLDLEGNLLWSRSFGDPNQQLAVNVQTDSAGNILFTGFFVGSIDFGGGALTSAGGFDVFVAKLDPQGNHLWSHGFGGDQIETVAALAVGASDHVFVTGTFNGTVDFGAGPMEAHPGLLGDIFVIELDASGKLVQARAIAGDGQRIPYGLTLDAGGSPIVTGQFTGMLDAGGGPLETTSLGDYDAFVFKLDPAGNHVYSARFGDGKMQVGEAVSMAAPDQPIVGGAFDGTIDLGDGPYVDMPSMFPVDFDLFVTKLDCKPAP